MSKAKPDVKVMLDRERTLRLDLNAMEAFEEATDISFLKGDFDYSKMSIKQLKTLIWACLLGEDESVTLKQVGEWIGLSNITEVMQQIAKAFESAIPDDLLNKDKEEDTIVPLAENPNTPPG